MKHGMLLFAASVVPLREQAAFQKGYGRISAERRDRTDRYRFDKDKCLSVGAELLLQYALGVKSTPEIYYGAQGKPYLKNGPFFNVSHAGEYVLCAVSAVEVGCDIENIAQADLRLAKRFFAPPEYDALCALAEENAQNELFYRYWVLKESFIKATGTGLKCALNGFCIDLASLTVQQHSDDKTYHLYEEALPGYRIGLCAAGERNKVLFSEVDLNTVL